MNTGTRPDQDRLARRGRARRAAGVAVAAAVSYGVGVGLARATQRAEDLEEDEFCHPANARLPV